jgi:hypothetical protein
MSKLAHTTSAISIQFREIDFANNYIFHATIISIAWRGFLETFALDAPVFVKRSSKFVEKTALVIQVNIS